MNQKPHSHALINTEHLCCIFFIGSARLLPKTAANIGSLEENTDAGPKKRWKAFVSKFIILKWCSAHRIDNKNRFR